MSLKTLPKYIPFLVALFFVLAHVVEVQMNNYRYRSDGMATRELVIDQVLYGGIALALVLTLIIAKKSVWKQLFGFVILLSFTPVLKFSSSTFSMGIGPLSIDIIALALLIGHLSFNGDAFNFIRDMVKPGAASKKGQLDQFEAGVENFKRRFSGKSKEELEDIADNPSMSKEAREAARRLLAVNTSI